ncbi:hypothetical protein OFN46_34490, partial [Escherichia coli]|nr:hypothetical protein [Escherichia coli]
KALERDLKQLRAQCGRSREAKDCGILEGLAKTAQQPAQTKARQAAHLDSSHPRGKAGSLHSA